MSLFVLDMHFFVHCLFCQVLTVSAVCIAFMHTAAAAFQLETYVTGANCHEAQCQQVQMSA